MPNKKAKSNTPAASPKGRRVTSAIRARGLHNFLDDITRLCRAYGFRIESEDVGRSLAIFDEREERPDARHVADDVARDECREEPREAEEQPATDVGAEVHLGELGDEVRRAALGLRRLDVETDHRGEHAPIGGRADHRHDSQRHGRRQG